MTSLTVIQKISMNSSITCVCVIDGSRSAFCVFVQTLLLLVIKNYGEYNMIYIIFLRLIFFFSINYWSSRISLAKDNRMYPTTQPMVITIHYFSKANSCGAVTLSIQTRLCQAISGIRLKFKEGSTRYNKYTLVYTLVVALTSRLPDQVIIMVRPES